MLEMFLMQGLMLQHATAFFMAFGSWWAEPFEAAFHVEHGNTVVLRG